MNYIITSLFLSLMELAFGGSTVRRQSHIDYNVPITVSESGKVASGVRVMGMAILNKKLFVLPMKAAHIKAYDVTSNAYMYDIQVPGMVEPHDIVASSHSNSLFIAGYNTNQIYKLEPSPNGPSVSSWKVPHPVGLSLARDGRNIMVTSQSGKNVSEWTTKKDLVRVVRFPVDVTFPWHAIELENGQFLFSYQLGVDARICYTINVPRRSTAQKVQTVDASLGTCYGKEKEQRLGAPTHLAVDQKGNVFVADSFYSNEHRVILLSSSLKFVAVLVPDVKPFFPMRILLDETHRRLYVGMHDNAVGEVRIYNVKYNKYW